MKIIFTDIDNLSGVLPQPQPASNYIPEWYKNAKSYLTDNGKKQIPIERKPYSSVKRCMPVWDMMTAGYIMETPYDIGIRQTETGPIFQWLNDNTVAFQSHEQFQNHPFSRDINYAVRIKIPWSIKTPKGWSILVLPLQHREVGPIEGLSGIVDTDKWAMPFNMFIKLTDPKFEGIIPAGTPFLQIIPFKRSAWKAQLGGEKEKMRHKVNEAIFGRIFFDRYKKFWWQKKEYK